MCEDLESNRRAELIHPVAKTELVESFGDMVSYFFGVLAAEGPVQKVSPMLQL